MTEILYPMRKEFSAPWLIDFDKLELLDEVIEKQHKELLDYREKGIQAAIKEEISNYKDNEQHIVKEKIEEQTRNSYEFCSEFRKVTILLSKGREVQAESFKEASKEQFLQDEVPIGFSAKLEVGSTKVEITLGEYDRDEIRYKVDSNDSAIAKDIIYDIESWIKSVLPRLWLRIWKKVYGWHFNLIFLWVLCAAVTLPVVYKQFQSEIKKDVEAIIVEGIDSDNIEKAIEFVLIYASNYVPEQYRTNVESWLRKLIVFSSIFAVVILILSFPPKSNIGIGKGESRIRRWRVYLRIVSFTIPVVIILPIILNQIQIL